jgi:hypothetical protein
MFGKLENAMLDADPNCDNAASQRHDGTELDLFPCFNLSGAVGSIHPTLA